MFNQILSSISSISSTITNCGAPASFKFVIGAEEGYLGSFVLHQGKAKSGLLPGSIPISQGGECVTIFVCRQKSDAAVNAMKKLVSLRHPGIVRVLDTAESDTGIYIATEWVEPVTSAIPGYGLYQILKTVNFLHSDCKLVQGSLEKGIVLTSSGSYKIAGFERSSPFDDRGAKTDLLGYMALTGRVPENVPANSDFKVLAHWMRNSENQSLRSELIQSSILRNANEYLYFNSNEEIQTIEGLETIHLKTESESIKFLSKIKTKNPIILNLLLTSVLSISSLIVSAIPIIISISEGIENEIFQKNVEPKILPLFQIQDRSIRFKLLVGLPNVANKFSANVVENQIVPELISGFTDSHPSIREQTMKTIELLIAHVGVKTIEKKLIPNVVSLLRDPESGIRTLAISGLPKLAAPLSFEKRTDVLNACILAGLKDGHVPAKLAALSMVRDSEISSQRAVFDSVKLFLPLIGLLLIDEDLNVRQSGFETIESVLTKLRSAVKTYCETSASRTSANASYQGGSSISSDAANKTNPYVQANAANTFVAPQSNMTQPNSYVQRPNFPAYIPPKPSAPFVPSVAKSEVDFDSFWADIAAPPSSNDQNSLI